MSKCRSLFINISSDKKGGEMRSMSGLNFSQQWCDIRINYFKTIMAGDNKFQSNWLTSMFESLNILHIVNHAIIILPLLPINLLFDNRKSHLNEFRSRLTPGYTRLHFRFYLDWKLSFYSEFYSKFEHNYVKYFEQFKADNVIGNKKYYNYKKYTYEKCLQSVELRPFTRTINIINNDLFFQSLDSKWLILTYSRLDKYQLKQYLKHHPNIEQLSMRRILFVNQNDVNSNNNSNTNNNISDDKNIGTETCILGISTLKITTYCEGKLFSAYQGFLDNQANINELNFQNSVKNITLHTKIIDNHFDNDPYRYDSVNDGKKFVTNLIISLLKKTYLHKLESITLLFELSRFTETQE